MIGQPSRGCVFFFRAFSGGLKRQSEAVEVKLQRIQRALLDRRSDRCCCGSWGLRCGGGQAELGQIIQIKAQAIVCGMCRAGWSCSRRFPLRQRGEVLFAGLL